MTTKTQGIGLNGSYDLLNQQNSLKSSIGAALAAGIALVTSQFGVVVNEKQRRVLRVELDGFVKSTFLPTLHAGLIPMDQQQTLHDTLDKSYVFAYGNDIQTARRHGMLRRPTVIAYKRALGVDDSGAIKKNPPALGKEVLQAFARAHEIGFDGFIKDRLDIKIGLPSVTRSEGSDNIGAGGIK